MKWKRKKTLRFPRQPDSHEAVLPLALLQRVLDEGPQLEKEQLLGGFGCGAGSAGVTVLLTQCLRPGVA